MILVSDIITGLINNQKNTMNKITSIDSKKTNNKNIKVTVYSTPTCHFCHMAKDYFSENNVAFDDFDVAMDLSKRREMVEKSGQLGVPVIVIGEETIIGFDKTRIDQALGLGMQNMRMAA